MIHVNFFNCFSFFVLVGFSFLVVWVFTCWLHNPQWLVPFGFLFSQSKIEVGDRMQFFFPKTRVRSQGVNYHDWCVGNNVDCSTFDTELALNHQTTLFHWLNLTQNKKVFCSQGKRHLTIFGAISPHEAKTQISLVHVTLSACGTPTGRPTSMQTIWTNVYTTCLDTKGLSARALRCLRKLIY